MGPRFRSRPTTKNGVSWMLQASFSAMESIALFCTHVTSAAVPAGRRLLMMWKIVVDFPAGSTGSSRPLKFCGWAGRRPGSPTVCPL